MKYFIWVVLVVLSVNYASAQDVYTSSGKPGYHKKATHHKKGYDPEKLILGGGITLDFGTDYVVAGLSPIVGYRFTDHFSAGVGLGYLYFKVPDPYFYYPPYYTYYDKVNQVYPNVWARMFVYRNIYLVGSFEVDLMSGTYPNQDQATGEYYTYKQSRSAESLLLGVGLKQPLGGRVSVFGEIQHEFLQQTYSPYAGQPLIFNAGICAGL